MKTITNNVISELSRNLRGHVTCVINTHKKYMQNSQWYDMMDAITKAK